MNIYFINLDSIIKHRTKNELVEIYGNFHHHFSRKFLKTLIEKIYKQSGNITDINGKPILENSNLNFSISHSENIIAIAFNENDGAKIGIDIEQQKNRDFNKILKYYGYNTENNVSKEDFFQIWTTYEAEYKSGVQAELMTFNYKDFTVTISSDKKINTNLYEIYPEGETIGTIKKYSLPPKDMINTKPQRLK